MLVGGRRLRLSCFYLFVLFTCLIALVSCVDRNNFKTCEQSSFCRRSRRVQSTSTRYVIKNNSLQTTDNVVSVRLLDEQTNHEYSLQLQSLAVGGFRVEIDELEPLKLRYRVNDSLMYEPQYEKLEVVSDDDQKLVIISGNKKSVIYALPFRIDFYIDDVLVVSANARNWLYFEYQRKKRAVVQKLEPEPTADDNAIPLENEQKPVDTPGKVDDEPEAWEESFKSHPDSKPFGPQAVALDFTFPEAEVLFGIPEHADSFILKSTAGTDPYRLYNLDVFEYEVNSKMALYGSVPVLYGHGLKNTAGVFWNNAAETWVDIRPGENNVMSSLVNFVSGASSDPPVAHFISESGIIDAFVLLGPKPLDAFSQYAKLTGTAPLPQIFALAYHQCRWNYKDQKDVTSVSTTFDKYDIPMDTMWLDIEYTDGKKYFTWDKTKFSEPLDMIKNLTDLGRHLVIIIDPHIKRDNNYFFHNDCIEKGYYVKTPDNRVYEGWCWPGSASYPDFFNPEVREYYASQYELTKFKTTTADVMIWNDMNEPSVFNGPEVTAPKDLIHYGGWEHRDVHNLYGHMHLLGTYSGLLNRDPNQRPFILTRAHFAGSQRFAAVWTGDNLASWDHLQHSLKMCLSEAVAGFSFCGADVGGFFGNTEVKLLQRWYQTGAFLPFFRAHAHIDTKRREPWLFDQTTLELIRDAVRLRYTYLPLWYTAFYEHTIDYKPVIRPLLAHYPYDKDCYNIDNQLLIQDRLLVRPVTEEGVKSIDVYFPKITADSHDIWYDALTYKRFDQAGYVNIPVTDTTIPHYQRGGSIIPRKMRFRRTSKPMIADPYTLVVCLDRNGKSQGTLYIDDEKSFKYKEQNEYRYINYVFESNELSNNFIHNAGPYADNWIERIIIAGLKRTPVSATLTTADGTTSTLHIKKEHDAIVIRKPAVKVSVGFTIKLNY